MRRFAKSSPRVLAGAAAVACVTAVLAQSSPADAGLITPPGPWPVAIAGAANPLAGTPGALNGVNATPNTEVRVWLHSAQRRHTMVTKTAGRYVVARGLLLNKDTLAPIAHAKVLWVAQNTSSADWNVSAVTTTNAAGHFSATFPVLAHHRHAAMYYPSADTPVVIMSRRLLVRARSRVWLDHPVNTGRTHRVRGRVQGAPIPPGGLLVALQVRNSHRRWITTRHARTDANGRYRLRYRFPFGRFPVRIVVPAQSTWPLYGGRSASRLVTRR